LLVFGRVFRATALDSFNCPLGALVGFSGERRRSNQGQQNRQEEDTVEPAGDEDNDILVEEVQREVGKLGKCHGEHADEGGQSRIDDREDNETQGLVGTLSARAGEDHEEAAEVGGELDRQTNAHNDVDDGDTIELQAEPRQVAIDLDGDDGDDEQQDGDTQRVVDEGEEAQGNGQGNVAQLGREIGAHVQVLLVQVVDQA